MKEQKNKWKILAIIFIILFVLENLLLIHAYQVGVSQIQKENQCGFLCKDKYYQAYWYDSMTNNCDCYKNGEIVYVESLR